MAQWLEELGDSEYAQTFADNDIDLETLPHLRDEDFERLGVSLGHMRKLQAAIVALSVEEPPTEEVAPSAPERRPAEAERRQLTVMFCDLVGSTALSDREQHRDRAWRHTAWRGVFRPKKRNRPVGQRGRTGGKT